MTPGGPQVTPRSPRCQLPATCMKSSTLVTRPTAWDRRSMTRYTRYQLIVLLVLLGAAGLGLAVGHWRRAHPDLSDRLEQFERTPRAASPLAPPAPVSSAPQRQPSSQALIDLNREIGRASCRERV